MPINALDSSQQMPTVRIGDFIGYESASSSDVADPGGAGFGSNSSSSCSDEGMRDEGLLLRRDAADANGAGPRVQLRRPTVILFGATTALSVAFTACIIILARRSQDSTTLFVGAVVSALLLALLILAALFLYRNAYVAPIKFESMLVVIGIVQTVIFFTTVTTAVYHAAGVEFMRTLFEVLGPVDRLLVIATTAVYGAMMLAVFVMFLHLSRVRAAVYTHRARSVATMVERRRRARARRLRDMRRAFARTIGSPPAVPPAEPTSPPPVGARVDPPGNGGGDGIGGGGGGGVPLWNGGYNVPAPRGNIF